MKDLIQTLEWIVAPRQGRPNYTVSIMHQPHVELPYWEVCITCARGLGVRRGFGKARTLAVAITEAVHGFESTADLTDKHAYKKIFGKRKKRK